VVGTGRAGQAKAGGVRPNSAKVKNLKSKDYLGPAVVYSSSETVLISFRHHQLTYSDIRFNSPETQPFSLST